MTQAAPPPDSAPADSPEPEPEPEHLAWTDDRIASLRRLWAEGLSASQVAKALGGGATRNSVVGKVHRLGIGRPAPPTLGAALHARPSGGKRGAPFPRAEAPGGHGDRVLAFALPPSRDLAAQRGLKGVNLAPAPLAELEPHQCRWPIGDPQEPGFGFCGRYAGAATAPYCPRHHRRSRSRAAQPPVEELIRALRRYL